MEKNYLLLLEASVLLIYSEYENVFSIGIAKTKHSY